jgi:hypothetical protein
MKTQIETKMTAKVPESLAETENPMQERHIGKVAESVVETAEAVLTARRLEACVERGRSIREEAGSVFVP